MRKMTYDDIANFYYSKTGRQARVQPMDAVVLWVCAQPEVYVDEEDYIWLKETHSD